MRFVLCPCYQLCWPPLDSFKDLNIPFILRSPEQHAVFKVKLLQQKNSWKMTAFYWLAEMCSEPPHRAICPLGCPGTLLAHAELLSPAPLSPFLLSCSLVIWLPSLVPKCSTQNFLLLSFMLSLMAQCSNLSRSLRKASHPSRQPAAPLSFCVIGKCAGDAFQSCIPASRSSSVLNRSGSAFEPWRTPLVISCWYLFAL